MHNKTDIVIVGSGISGLFASLNIDSDKNIILVTKKKLEDCNSYLAQGGICVLKDDLDYNDFFNDTLKAGHDLNDKISVDLMIKNSRDVINDLINYNVEFNKENNNLKYTKEGSHSTNRIVYHKDITGKEVITKLILEVKKRKNITILEDTTFIDIIVDNNNVYKVVCENEKVFFIESNYTILATGGIGGLFENTTNFSHLTADSAVVALNHKLKLKDFNYIQYHPTTLFSEEKGKRFLLTESIRGEGGILLNENKERFIDELLPRDIVTKAILNEMKKYNTKFVYLSLQNIEKEEILSHFPNIYNHCLENNIDITNDLIPVVPSMHYHMGGIYVDYNSKTKLNNLYVIGEASCNGVHGKNRLASNSLLESLVFAKIACKDINTNYKELNQIDKYDYTNLNYQKIKKMIKEN